MSDFDFGFTAVDEDQIDFVANSQQVAEDAQKRLDARYNAIMPLLTNLQKNPEKEYILWPDRLQKVEQFRDHLTKIYGG